MLLSTLLAGLAMPVLAATPVTPPLSVADTGATATLFINLRKDPDLGSPIVAQLRKDSRVTVLGESGEFVHVQTAAGTRGYVKRKYLVMAMPALPAVALPVSNPVAVPRVAVRPAPDLPQEAAVPLPTPVAAVAPDSGSAPSATPVVTAQPSRWYVRAGLGQYQPGRDALDVGELLRNEGFPVFVNRLDDEALQLHFNAGFQLLPNVSLEAGILHLDDVGFTLTIDDPAHPKIPELQQRLEQLVPATGTGFTAAAIAHWDYAAWRFSARVAHFASLGRHVDITVDGRKLALRTRDRQSLLLGAGLEYALSPQWRVGIDYQGLELVDDLRLMGATLTYQP